MPTKTTTPPMPTTTTTPTPTTTAITTSGVEMVCKVKFRNNLKTATYPTEYGKTLDYIY